MPHCQTLVHHMHHMAHHATLPNTLTHIYDYASHKCVNGVRPSKALKIVKRRCNATKHIIITVLFSKYKYKYKFDKNICHHSHNYIILSWRFSESTFIYYYVINDGIAMIPDIPSNATTLSKSSILVSSPCKKLALLVLLSCSAICR